MLVKGFIPFTRCLIPFAVSASYPLLGGSFRNGSENPSQKSSASSSRRTLRAFFAIADHVVALTNIARCLPERHVGPNQTFQGTCTNTSQRLRVQNSVNMQIETGMNKGLPDEGGSLNCSGWQLVDFFG